MTALGGKSQICWAGADEWESPPNSGPAHSQIPMSVDVTEKQRVKMWAEDLNSARRFTTLNDLSTTFHKTISQHNYKVHRVMCMLLCNSNTSFLKI